MIEANRFEKKLSGFLIYEHVFNFHLFVLHPVDCENLFSINIAVWLSW